MKKEQIDLTDRIRDELEIKEFIRKEMVDNGFKIADIMYCFCTEVEEMCLRIKRENKLED